MSVCKSCMASRRAGAPVASASTSHSSRAPWCVGSDSSSPSTLGGVMVIRLRSCPSTLGGVMVIRHTHTHTQTHAHTPWTIMQRERERERAVLQLQQHLVAFERFCSPGTFGVEKPRWRRGWRRHRQRRQVVLETRNASCSVGGSFGSFRLRHGLGRGARHHDREASDEDANAPTA